MDDPQTNILIKLRLKMYCMFVAQDSIQFSHLLNKMGNLNLFWVYPNIRSRNSFNKHNIA